MFLLTVADKEIISWLSSNTPFLVLQKENWLLNFHVRNSFLVKEMRGFFQFPNSTQPNYENTDKGTSFWKALGPLSHTDH